MKGLIKVFGTFLILWGIPYLLIAFIASSITWATNPGYIYHSLKMIFSVWGFLILLGILINAHKEMQKEHE